MQKLEIRIFNYKKEQLSTFTIPEYNGFIPDKGEDIYINTSKLEVSIGQYKKGECIRCIIVKRVMDLPQNRIILYVNI